MITDLVRFRNSLLDNYKQLTNTADQSQKRNVVTQLNQDNPQQGYLLDLVKLYNSKAELDREVITTLDDIITVLEADILHQVEIQFSGPDYLAKFSDRNHVRPSGPYTHEIQEHISSKISGYSSQAYPSLQIMPLERIYTVCMVASDPLYLTDTNINKQSFRDLLNTFPPQYQSRLRCYPIADRNFSQLPQEQFAFVLAWDFFTGLAQEYVTEYLKQVYTLLRSGGTFMFNYVNCDRVEGCIQAQEGSESWNTETAIKQVALDIGYEIADLHNISNAESNWFRTVSWVELKKPGKLQSMKNSQSLGEVLLK